MILGNWQAFLDIVLTGNILHCLSFPLQAVLCIPHRHTVQEGWDPVLGVWVSKTNLACCSVLRLNCTHLSSKYYCAQISLFGFSPLVKTTQPYLLTVTLYCRCVRDFSHLKCLYYFIFSFPSAQSDSLLGGPGVHQVWTGPVLKNPDPLCDPLASVFGETESTVMVNLFWQNELTWLHVVSDNLVTLWNTWNHVPQRCNHDMISVLIISSTWIDKQCVSLFFLIFSRPSLHSCACMEWCGLLKTMVQDKRFHFFMPLCLF